MDLGGEAAAVAGEWRGLAAHVEGREEEEEEGLLHAGSVRPLLWSGWGGLCPEGGEVVGEGAVVAVFGGADLHARSARRRFRRGARCAEAFRSSLRIGQCQRGRRGGALRSERCGGVAAFAPGFAGDLGEGGALFGGG